MREFDTKTNITVTDKDIAYWVITAFEGGSTHWCDEAKCVERDEHGQWVEITDDRYKSFQIDGCGPYANPEFWDNDKRGYLLHDEYDQKYVAKALTLSGLLKALNYQPPQVKGQSKNWYRKVVHNLITENYDAGDADSIVQVATLGEVVYG
jgi:hypothetical protein